MRCGVIPGNPGNMIPFLIHDPSMQPVTATLTPGIQVGEKRCIGLHSSGIVGIRGAGIRKS